MSSPIRRIQKKGTKIGQPRNEAAHDLLARLTRERKREETALTGR